MVDVEIHLKSVILRFSNACAPHSEIPYIVVVVVGGSKILLLYVQEVLTHFIWSKLPYATGQDFLDI